MVELGFLMTAPDILFGVSSLKELLYAAADEGNNVVVIHTTGQPAYLEMTENLICGLSKTDMAGVVIFAFDTATYSHFHGRFPVTLAVAPGRNVDHDIIFEKRPEIIATVIRFGFNALFLDCDIAILSNRASLGY